MENLIWFIILFMTVGCIKMCVGALIDHYPVTIEEKFVYGTAIFFSVLCMMIAFNKLFL